MRIIAFDPGLRHVVWTVTEWSDKTEMPHLERISDSGICYGDRGRKVLSLDAVWAMVQSLQSARWEDLLPHADYCVIETQHLKNSKVKREDIRDLAMVTGALACAVPEAVTWAPTGPGGWSASKKEIRHNRLRDHYFPHIDFDAAFESYVKRVKGDLLDTVGMAFWVAQGQPRSGV